MEAPADKALTFFNVARSYHVAADELLRTRNQRQVFYNDSVVRVNYALSVELYLKSFLIDKGIPPSQLSQRRYGHNLANLLDSCQTCGLRVEEAIASRIRRLSELETLTRDRYLDWVRETVPKAEPLGELPACLASEIGPQLAARRGYVYDHRGLSKSE